MVLDGLFCELVPTNGEKYNQYDFGNFLVNISNAFTDTRTNRKLFISEDAISSEVIVASFSADINPTITLWL